MAGPAMLDLLSGVISDAIASSALLFGAHVHLFGAAHTPARTDALATYTAIESGWAGYAVQTPAWTGVALTAGDQPAFSKSGALTFGPNTSGSTQSIYGWYITDSTDSVLFGAEEFAGAPIPLPDGVALSFEITFQDISEF